DPAPSYGPGGEQTAVKKDRSAREKPTGGGGVQEVSQLGMMKGSRCSASRSGAEQSPRNPGGDAAWAEASAGPHRAVSGGDAMRAGRLTGGLSGARPLRIVALLSVLAFLAPVPSASAAGADHIRRVLVLYPVSDGQPGILLFDQGLRSTFKKSSNERIEIYN